MVEAFSLHIPAGFSLDTQTLRFFADAIPHQVWIAGAHGHPIYANKQWYDYTGLTAGEAEKQHWRSVFHPEDRARVRRAWRDALATGANLQSEVRLKRRDGVYCWHSICAAAQRDAEGNIWLWVGTCADINDQKQMEQTLKASEENFRVLAETVPQLVWTDLADGSLIYCNQRHLDYLQATFEDIQGFGWQHFLHPGDLERVLALECHSQETGEPYEAEHRLKNGQTGNYRWFLTRAIPVHDKTGQIVKWFGTSTDIDEKKRIEEALRESDTRFRRLVASNIVGVTITDPGGTIHEANEAFLSLVGYTQEDLEAGQIQWTAMTPPEYRGRDAQATNAILTTGAFPPYEKEYIRKDGQRVPVLVGGALFRWEGSAPQWVTLTQDLTAPKEVERQKDLFLAITSHEMKTPLTALKGTLQLVQRRAKQLALKAEVLSPEQRTLIDDLSKRLVIADRQVDIQTHLINDLLDVSRIAANTLKLDLGPYDLVSIVRETVEDLLVTAPARSLPLALPEHLAVIVLVDRGRIGQVIKNYVTNAIRYSPPDQPIQIGLSIQEQSARVWVRDKGPGLTEEAQKEVWQRFHQIKGVTAQGDTGKGLGLGLYLCQMLIAQHQGQVGVESTLGEGSTFWFALPLIN